MLREERAHVCQLTVRFLLLSLHSKHLFVLCLYSSGDYKVPPHAWSSSVLPASREPGGSADKIYKCEFFCTSACLEAVQSYNVGCCREEAQLARSGTDFGHCQPSSLVLAGGLRGGG